MAAFAPELMLQRDKGFNATVCAFFKALLALILQGVAVVGYFRMPMNVIERVLAFIAASLMVVALPITDELGFSLPAIMIGWHSWCARSAAPLTV